MGGQYTISVAFSCTPFSRTSWITPITSRHGRPGSSVNRLPIAFAGVPHVSPRQILRDHHHWPESVHVIPSQLAAGDESRTGRGKEARRNVLVKTAVAGVTPSG